MERTDWLDEGFDSSQARFLMVTAITHHRFSSPLWGEGEVRKLEAELAEIETRVAETATAHHGRNERLNRYFPTNALGAAQGT